MAVEKKSVSLPEEMYTAALARAKRLRYDSFSEYVQYLIKRDLDELPTHSVVREDPVALKRQQSGDRTRYSR